MAALGMLLGVAAAAPGAGKDRKPPVAYAVVAGTVFRDTGLSLPGAVVELTARGPAEGARKFRKMTLTTDGRGEFAFRVPPVEAEYNVKVEAKGFQGEEKPVSVAGEQRIDVFFRLTPTSK